MKNLAAMPRKQRIDDWWQPTKPEPDPKAAEPITGEDWFDPFNGFNWDGWTP